jgi:hypothetical protein
MAKIYHVRLTPSEAKPIILLSRRGSWSFNHAAKQAIKHSRHPLLRKGK